jgi:ATP-dependent helicase/nuclease subunit A
MADERAATPEQLAAIRVRGSAAVRAGAGAGKTRVLAEHFLHLLRGDEGQPPPVEQVSEILAITFTEKAAAEMKTKIRELLGAEAARAPVAERPRWERARRELLGAQISTIHAFCHRVVRENPIEAAVDPASVLLDEHESKVWRENAVEDALTARLRAGDAGARLLVGRFGLRRGRDGGAVGHCLRLLDRLATTGHDADWVVETTAAQAARVPDAERALRASCDRLVARIEEVVGGKGRTERVERLREAWPRWKPILHGLRGDSPRADVLRLAELLPLLSRIVTNISDELCADGGKLGGSIPAYWGALAAREPSAAVAALLADVARSVRARRDADGVLTFDDLILEARGVLTRHPAVRDRYARRFRAILVDEFQDTDAVQAGLVQALAGDAVPLFVVGDEKQSIYGFRGADVSVFHSMRERLGRDLTLGRNFRSQPAILQFVNALAEQTLRLPPTVLDPSYWTVFDDTQRLVPDRPQTWKGPGVRLVSFVAEQEKRSGEISTGDMRELEARVLAGVIRGLHDGDDVPFGGITVLFRALTEVKLYEHALRRSQIPYYVVKGRGFFQCQEIRDLLNLLAAIGNVEDALALAAVLRSPFFAFDDDLLARLAWPADRSRPDLARRFRPAETFADLPEEAARPPPGAGPAGAAAPARQPGDDRRAPRGGARRDGLRGGLPDAVPGHAESRQRPQADRAGARRGAPAPLRAPPVRRVGPRARGARAARAGGHARRRAGRRRPPDDDPPGEGARVRRRDPAGPRPPPRERPQPRGAGRRARRPRPARRRGRRPSAERLAEPVP